MIAALLTGLALYLAFGAAYVLFFAAAGRVISPRERRMRRVADPTFLVLLPAYREDAVIVEAARAALSQTIDAARFTVVVVADSLRVSTVLVLRALGVKVVPFADPDRTKAKALLAGMLAVTKPHDVVVVLDADNRPAPDFLEALSARFTAGARAVQGQRVAANADTPFARLDALSEAVNNHVFRRGHAAVGLSAALIGSGMAFERRLFEELIRTSTAVGGFDKEFELRLLGQGVRIEWAEDARVLDEKVRSADVFRRQRTRWLAAQVHYLKVGMAGTWRAARAGNVDYLDKVLQQALPPRILVLAGLPVVSLAGLLLALPTVATLGLLGLAAAVAGIWLAIPAGYRGLVTTRLLFHLPVAAFGMLRALARTPRANRSFIHTPHGPAAA